MTVITWKLLNQKSLSMKKCLSLLCGAELSEVLSLIIRLPVDTVQGHEPVALHGAIQLLLNTIDNRTNMFELSYNYFQIKQL